ncbi:hypothetical protein [Arthrobacter sp. H5]|uniref:hypothetical protein n=1 Tax=Arthrobacter sp. H5 TaxID=1267973 RepID=UPI0004BCA1FD|nr:hypothetical protein [Arthrobacter sp. H5]
MAAEREDEFHSPLQRALLFFDSRKRKTWAVVVFIVIWVLLTLITPERTSLLEF